MLRIRASPLQIAMETIRRLGSILTQPEILASRAITAALVYVRSPSGPTARWGVERRGGSFPGDSAFAFAVERHIARRPETARALHHCPLKAAAQRPQCSWPASFVGCTVTTRAFQLIPASCSVSLTTV